MRYLLFLAPQPGRPRRAWATASLLALGALATALLAACGSSAPAASRAAVLGTATHQQCTSVADVLSDGPDPDADPVGYAQAQVLPLQQLKIGNAQLSTAVKSLDSAYQAYAGSTGGASTTAAHQVSKSEAAVNAICPGAAS